MYNIEQYSLLQWEMIFICYCIFGWIFESVYCSIKSGKLQNRGFCHGPWIPIYGFGATLLIMLVGSFRSNLPIVFITGVAGGTALELLTGFAMEKLFHMRWWDYSDNAFNFHGYISLLTSLAWGFLALVIMYNVHPLIERIAVRMNGAAGIVMNTVMYTLLIEDLIFSAIGAVDLRRRLQSLADNSEEIQRLRSSLQDAYARFGEAKHEFDTSIESVQDVRKAEGNVAAARAAVMETVKAVRSGVGVAEDGVRALERRLNMLLDGGNDSGRGYMSWWSKTMLRNNPDAVSKEPGFGMLRDAALKRREKRKKDNKKKGNS